MLAASGSFAALVTDVEYYGAWKVSITLPGSVYPDLTFALSSLEIQAQTVTDLPSGSRLQVGYPSMDCSFTVSGLVDQTDETKTAAWLFGRYSTTSPLYHQDALYAAVTVDLGLYTGTSGGTPEFVRKFTGVVDDYTCNDDGSVSFTCIDKVRATLRSVPALLGVVTGPPYNAGLTSEFAIDRLLRAATSGTMSSWPAPRSGVVIAVGFRSSLWPEVGTLDTVAAPDPTPYFAPAAYGSGLAAQAGVAYTAPVYAQANNNTTGDDIFVECFVTGVDTGTVVHKLGNIQLTVSSTGATLRLGNSGSPTVTASQTNGAGVHYAAYHIHNVSGIVSGFVQMDSVNQGFAGLTPGTGATAPFVYEWLPVAPTGNATIAAVQVTTETSPTTNQGFTPTAVLDPSLNTLDAVPDIAAGDPFQTIQQIADAELAVAGGDESGTFRFWNRDTIRGMTSQRAITSAASLTSIGGVETTAASVTNHATVEYTGYNFATANTTIWQTAAARKVARGSTRTFVATTDTLFAQPDLSPSNLANGSSDVTHSHYRASTDRYGTAEFTGTLSFVITQTGSNTLNIAVTNSSGQDAWFVSPANYTDVAVGTPLLRIAGLTVTQADTLTADFQYPNPASGSRFGEQATQITGNPWIQDDDTAALLAYDMVQDGYLPKPNLTGLAIVPDPRIQLIDVVHPQDPDRTGVDEYARTFGWEIYWQAASDPSSAMTYDMSLDARTVALPGGWIGGVAGRSEGGTTTWGY